MPLPWTETATVLLLQDDKVCNDSHFKLFFSSIHAVKNIYKIDILNLLC